MVRVGVVIESATSAAGSPASALPRRHRHRRQLRHLPVTCCQRPVEPPAMPMRAQWTLTRAGRRCQRGKRSARLRGDTRISPNATAMFVQLECRQPQLVVRRGSTADYFTVQDAARRVRPGRTRAVKSEPESSEETGRSLLGLDGCVASPAGRRHHPSSSPSTSFT